MSMPDSLTTQRGRILNLLISARGAWVPLPEITACAAQYGARVLELRRLGFRIENRTKKVDGTRHSWFRLISGPVPADAPPAAPCSHSAESHIGAAAPTHSTQREREETLPLFPGAHS